eukprot:CAMPEP_0181290162 /NCGR_PEP_ID=MMETSP1101-20121128/1271_1 /TAXON_ID=46948 /ORGANISM="Rhodomonas abbreviata, Strain Caron Lab Isolate" /LENGTH=448 /DNA_ID=CAMNT_0023394437 /DNA_START=328 /DNA_END=1670 /DNA_ORIENTATION=+
MPASIVSRGHQIKKHNGFENPQDATSRRFGSGLLISFCFISLLSQPSASQRLPIPSQGPSSPLLSLSPTVSRGGASSLSRGYASSLPQDGVSSLSSGVASSGARRRALSLRGGANVMDDDEDASVETRDKYEFNPPPDKDRYSHGVSPATLAGEPESESSSTKDEEEKKEKKKENENSEDDEPQWVEGQVKMGGRRLKYVDGWADYHRDILNDTYPGHAFVANGSRGETFSDYSLIYGKYKSVDLTKQDRRSAEYRRELNRTNPTHEWTWKPLDDYNDIEFGGIENFTRHEDIYAYDVMSRQNRHTHTFYFNDSLIVSNKTRLFGRYEQRPEWVPPNSENVPDHANSGWRILNALDDEERWARGELPMPFNEEDEREVKLDEERQINEQLCEAAEHGSIGMFKDLLELGANASYASPPDLLTPLHYASLNGHVEIVNLLLEAGREGRG